jgi:hypothetical protein
MLLNISRRITSKVLSAILYVQALDEKFVALQNESGPSAAMVSPSFK